MNNTLFLVGGTPRVACYQRIRNDTELQCPDTSLNKAARVAKKEICDLSDLWEWIDMHLKGKQGTSCLFVCVLRKMMKEEIYIQVRALMYMYILRERDKVAFSLTC